ncbi:hypothetical protein GCM10020227_08310 [Streptomyces flavovirens]
MHPLLIGGRARVQEEDAGQQLLPRTAGQALRGGLRGTHPLGAQLLGGPHAVADAVEGGGR